MKLDFKKPFLAVQKHAHISENMFMLKGQEKADRNLLQMQKRLIVIITVFTVLALAISH
jgi:hypothetical protein